MYKNISKYVLILTGLIVLIGITSSCAAREPASSTTTAAIIQPPTQTAAEIAPPPTSTPTPMPAPSPTSAPVLDPAALQNMTYLLEIIAQALPDSDGRVTLKDGAFEQLYPGAAERISIKQIKEARGDLNGDGLKDAVTLLAISTGGSGIFMHLAAVVNEGGVPRHAATLLLGDRVDVKSLAIKDGKIQLKMITQGPEDPMCCPTLEVSEEYQLLKDQLVTPEQGEVLPLAESAIRALEARDMDALAELVHSSAGLRFSPYSFVLPEHQVFSREQLPGLLADPTLYTWGNYDGSGEPIEMSFADYFDRFVYSKDFADAEQVSVDQRLGLGNTIDNSHEFYPEAVVVEYHVPGENPDYGGMDWQSLRLVFQQQEGAWYLVGVIHDEWTT